MRLQACFMGVLSLCFFSKSWSTAWARSFKCYGRHGRVFRRTSSTIMLWEMRWRPESRRSASPTSWTSSGCLSGTWTRWWACCCPCRAAWPEWRTPWTVWRRTLLLRRGWVNKEDHQKKKKKLFFIPQKSWYVSFTHSVHWLRRGSCWFDSTRTQRSWRRTWTAENAQFTRSWATACRRRALRTTSTLSRWSPRSSSSSASLRTKSNWARSSSSVWWTVCP